MEDHLCVVLVEGHLAILPVTAFLSAPALRSAVTLEAGERLEFENPTWGIKSKARLDREEAWTTGRVVFESSRLGSAIAEMNRYAPRRIELADAALADRLISGTFTVTDSHEFARAVAQTLSLSINDTPDAIQLRSSLR
jgi:transmembrane sensor